MSERFEVMPFARAVEEAGQLPEPVRLTVTCSPKHGLDHSIEVGTELRSLGHAVTIHFAARMVRSRDHLDEALGAMADAGIDDAFVVGGDSPEPLGPYASAVEIVPRVAEHPRRPATIGIAGYPEGHPLIDDAALVDALAAKAPYADYLTTQLCFDPEAILRFARGVDLPVLAGVPGLVDPARLLEISLRVGVGPSLRYLRKQRGLRNLIKLSSSSAERLSDALAGRDELAGFHYYTFNRLLDTWSWTRATTTKEVMT
ncbi:MAG TPA: methylenetetrahydrofolate reductase [Gaiellaceae bacterium]|nr:methylenetetrahydrofolate reductase [Gaiellaceae bacterium]